MRKSGTITRALLMAACVGALSCTSHSEEARGETEPTPGCHCHKTTPGGRMAAALMPDKGRLPAGCDGAQCRHAEGDELEWYGTLEEIFDENITLTGGEDQPTAVARRRGDDWYVALMGTREPARAEVPLSFLGTDERQKFLAYIYTDSHEGQDTTLHAHAQVLVVTPAQSLKFSLTGGGGAALRLTPVQGMAWRETDAYQDETL